MINLNLLIGINAATLLAVLVFGYKVVRFINNIEFKTDVMWKDYESRLEELKHGRTAAFN